MDATTINTLVGIIGAVVGVIGIIVGLMGLNCIHAAQQIRNTVITGKGGTVQQIFQNGVKLPEMIEAMTRITDQKMTPYMNSWNSLEEVQRVLEEDSRYSIPIVWSGSKAEYEMIVKENRMNPSVIYMVTD